MQVYSSTSNQQKRTGTANTVFRERRTNEHGPPCVCLFASWLGMQIFNDPIKVWCLRHPNVFHLSISLSASAHAVATVALREENERQPTTRKSVSLFFFWGKKVQISQIANKRFWSLAKKWFFQTCCQEFHWSSFQRECLISIQRALKQATIGSSFHTNIFWREKRVRPCKINWWNSQFNNFRQTQFLSVQCIFSDTKLPKKKHFTVN